MSAGATIEARDVGRTFHHGGETHEVLRGVNLRVESGRTLAVIGESGAGKSTLSRILAGLDRPTTGEVLLEGAPLRLRSGRLSPVQMVFQDPVGALDQRRTIGHSIAEPLRFEPRQKRAERVAEMLTAVGLDAAAASRRPRQFSGGQLQRVVLARALAARPKVLLCDEPTSALDVSVQGQILNLLLEMQASQPFACIVVTHDLLVARVLADDVLVLCDGQVLESQSADKFFSSPSSDYGRQLLEASGLLPETSVHEPR